MSYNKIAYLYDELMDEAPYEEWIEFTKATIQKFDMKIKTIIDLGCGTGNILIPFSKEGYKIIGVDNSSDMLAMAGEKIRAKNSSIQLIEQDMKELDLNTTVDLVICYCDSLNYLNSVEEIKQTFLNIKKHLSEDGYFIFDMHSPYKIKEVYNNNTFAWNDEDVSVIWIPDVDEDSMSVEHELTFFVKNKEGSYDKFEEYHKQRTYTPEVVCKILEEANFEVVDIFGDFKIQPVDEFTERIFYVARVR